MNYKGPSRNTPIQLIKSQLPEEYTRGIVEFLGCTIDLSKRPFIPRPETEHWVGRAIEEIKNNEFQITNSRKRVYCLDVFAGSGCIGLAILKHISNAVVDFAEKEERFLEQIKVNCKINGIDPKRYRLIQSDIFSCVKGFFPTFPSAHMRGWEGGEVRKYDYIFANPPYVAEERLHFVDQSVLDWEPREAWFGGAGGLEIIYPFLQHARNYLENDGKLYMEFDSTQKNAIRAMSKSFGYAAPSFFRDQYGAWRYLAVGL